MGLLCAACVLAADDCYTGSGADYRGTADVDENGNQCQEWPATAFDYTQADYSISGLGDGAYCRKPNNGVGPWCYWGRDKRAFRGYCRQIPHPCSTPQPPSAPPASPSQSPGWLLSSPTPAAQPHPPSPPLSRSPPPQSPPSKDDDSDDDDNPHLPMIVSEVTVSSGFYPREISWSLACDGLADPITGGAPYSKMHAVPPGPCTLTMFDSHGSSWDGAEWTAANWTARSFSLVIVVRSPLLQATTDRTVNGSVSFWAGPTKLAGISNANPFARVLVPFEKLTVITPSSSNIRKSLSI